MQKEFQPFFDHLIENRLAFPKCRDCNVFHWYPMKLCPKCQSRNITWLSIANKGRIFSWTLVRHNFEPENKHTVPYIVALVEFDDAPGVRLVTNLINTKPEKVVIDMPVEAVFPIDADSSDRVLFRPIDTSI